VVRKNSVLDDFLYFGSEARENQQFRRVQSTVAHFARTAVCSSCPALGRDLVSSQPTQKPLEDFFRWEKRIRRQFDRPTR